MLLNTCDCCGGPAEICFRPVDYGDGTGEDALALCLKCIHPDELADYALQIPPEPA